MGCVLFTKPYNNVYDCYDVGMKYCLATYATAR